MGKRERSRWIAQRGGLRLRSIPSIAIAIGASGAVRHSQQVALVAIENVQKGQKWGQWDPEMPGEAEHDLTHFLQCVVVRHGCGKGFWTIAWRSVLLFTSLEWTKTFAYAQFMGEFQHSKSTNYILKRLFRAIYQ